MANLELLVKQNAEAIQQLINDAKKLPDLTQYSEQFQDDDLLLYWVASLNQTVAIPFSVLKAQIVTTKEDANYIHTQGTASTIWNIAHNLGKYPAIQIKDTAGSKLEGEIDWVDLNNVTITFNVAVTGDATCN